MFYVMAKVKVLVQLAFRFQKLRQNNYCFHLRWKPDGSNGTGRVAGAVRTAGQAG